MVNGGFETDTVTGANPWYDYFDYMTPSSWTGSNVCIINYISVLWTKATNDNNPGANFIGLQSIGAYVMQTVTVPANSNFALTFDVSTRQGYHQIYPKLEVFRNAAANNGTYNY